MPRNLINKALSTIPVTFWDGKSTPRIVAVHIENSDLAGILLPSPGSHFKRDLTGRERRQMGNRTGAGCSSLSSYPHPCQSRWRRLCSSRLRAAGAPRRSAWGRDAAGGTSLQVDASPGRPGREGEGGRLLACWGSTTPHDGIHALTVARCGNWLRGQEAGLSFVAPDWRSCMCVELHDES